MSDLIAVLGFEVWFKMLKGGVLFPHHFVGNKQLISP